MARIIEFNPGGEKPEPVQESIKKTIDFKVTRTENKVAREIIEKFKEFSDLEIDVNHTILNEYQYKLEQISFDDVLKIAQNMSLEEMQKNPTYAVALYIVLCNHAIAANNEE